MLVNWKTASRFEKCAIIGLCLSGLIATGPRTTAQETRAKGEAAAGDKSWQAVAPGLVEPLSGEIKIAVPLVGRIGDVIVKPNDKVFAGQLLIRLDDEEARTRVASAEAQVALRLRVRNDKSARGRAADRRRAEDFEFD